jgi:phage terminase Nu1 subunit (DNA packaging protein)
LANDINLEKLIKFCETKGLKLTSRWYREMAKDDKVPPVIKGNVDALDALARLAVYYQAIGDHRADTSLRDEQKRKTRADADMAELELAEMQGALIRRDVVAQELTERVYTLKTDLLAIGRRVAKYPEAKVIVEKHIKQILNTYSQKRGVFKK